MSHIPCAFHIDFDPEDEKNGNLNSSVPMLTMHEYLDEVAEFIEQNSSSEDIELLQPHVMKRIATVLKKRHERGWSLESDYLQQQQLEQRLPQSQ